MKIRIMLNGKLVEADIEIWGELVIAGIDKYFGLQVNYLGDEVLYQIKNGRPTGSMIIIGNEIDGHDGYAAPVFLYGPTIKITTEK